MESVKYIVFGGGGQKGLLYIGAVKALRQYMNFDSVLKNVKGFCGSSVGAIFAVLMIMEYTEEEINEMVMPLVSSFDNVAPQMDVSLFISNYGFDDGSTLKKSLAKIIEFKGFSKEITLKAFQRFFNAEISFISTNLSTHEKVVLSASTFPDIKLVDALFMSMCVPFMFAPVHYNGNIYVDGCLICNIPDIFPVHETMILCFDRSYFPISAWSSYISQLITISVSLLEVKKQEMLESCAYSIMLKCPSFMKDSFDRNMNSVIAYKITKYGYVYTLLRINSNITVTMEILLKVVIMAYLNFYADLSIESAECLL
tara:strand:+ start:7248 stop:8186 length:939 start_codon:yes stop_codon:yes gene_type:complete